jgi:hypothetical protein
MRIGVSRTNERIHGGESKGRSIPACAAFTSMISALLVSSSSEQRLSVDLSSSAERETVFSWLGAKNTVLPE